jgi:hypothetical protein
VDNVVGFLKLCEDITRAVLNVDGLDNVGVFRT